MAEFWEIFKEIDLNNIIGVIVGSIFLLIIFVSCVESFWASRVEVILMSRAEVLKRHSLVYIMLFIVLSVMNYIFVFNDAFVVIDIIFFILSLIVYKGIDFLNRFEKFKYAFLKGREYTRFVLIVLFFAVMTHVISNSYDINKISCAILCGLAEIVVITLALSDYEPMESELVLKVADETWYVFRRMDDCLLCGDGKKLVTSKKIKLIKFDTILNDNLYFEKV